MLITRRNPIDDVVNSLDLDVTEEQLNNWKRGDLIQRAMPNLSADEREFIITGILPGQWETLMKEDDE